MLAIWNSGDRRDARTRIGAAFVGATIVAVAIVGPIVAHGAFWNLMWGLGSLIRDPFMSGNACNLWWVLEHLDRVTTSMSRIGLWAAVTSPAEAVPISPGALDYLRMIGLLFTLVSLAWAVAQVRRARDLWLLSVVAAFSVHAYATLAISVHENHLYAAVPLLALASGGRSRFIPIFVAVSTIVALNENLFYGIGVGVGYAIPRAVTIIDATVVLAVLNCATFAWHAAVFKSECSRPGQTTAPAGDFALDPAGAI